MCKSMGKKASLEALLFSLQMRERKPAPISRLVHCRDAQGTRGLLEPDVGLGTRGLS